jgi:hypothetical protein
MLKSPALSGSDQERREVELRGKEAEAEAAAAREHGDGSHHQHDLADDRDEDAERRCKRASGVSASRPHIPEPTRAVSSPAGGPGTRHCSWRRHCHRWRITRSCIVIPRPSPPTRTTPPR